MGEVRHSSPSFKSLWIKGKPNKGHQCRSWFTAAHGRPWPSEAEHPGFSTAIMALDAYLAGVAAVLVVCVSRALALRPEEMAKTSSEAMLRALRYAPERSDTRVRLPKVGIPGHVDFGDFTLCHSDKEGLEALDRQSSAWQQLPANELCFMSGAGLESKTKRQPHCVRAVEHRVMLNATERLSFCRLHGVSS